MVEMFINEEMEFYFEISSIYITLHNGVLCGECPIKPTRKLEKCLKWPKKSGGNEYYLFSNKSTVVDGSFMRYWDFYHGRF